MKEREREKAFGRHNKGNCRHQKITWSIPAEILLDLGGGRCTDEVLNDVNTAMVLH